MHLDVSYYHDKTEIHGIEWKSMIYFAKKLETHVMQ